MVTVNASSPGGQGKVEMTHTSMLVVCETGRLQGVLQRNSLHLGTAGHWLSSRFEERP